MGESPKGLSPTHNLFYAVVVELDDVVELVELEELVVEVDELVELVVDVVEVVDEVDVLPNVSGSCDSPAAYSIIITAFTLPAVMPELVKVMTSPLLMSVCASVNLITLPTPCPRDNAVDST